MPVFFTYGNIDDNLFQALITSMRKLHERNVVKNPLVTLDELRDFTAAFPYCFDKIIEILLYTKFIKLNQRSDKLQITELGLAFITLYNRNKDEESLP